MIQGLLAEGAFQEALSVLGPAPSPELGGGGHLWRAHAHLGLGQWQEAETAARLGLEACPGERGPTLALADALRGQGRLAQAEGIYLSLLSGDPRDVDVLGRYALLCALGGQGHKALRLLAEVSRINPQHPSLEGLTARIAWLAGERGPTGELSAALILTPQSAEGLRLRAQWRLKRWDPAETARQWDSLVASLPSGTDIDALVRGAPAASAPQDGISPNQTQYLWSGAWFSVVYTVIHAAIEAGRGGQLFAMYFAVVVTWFLYCLGRAKRKKRALLAIAEAWKAQGLVGIPQARITPASAPPLKEGGLT